MLYSGIKTKTAYFVLLFHSLAVSLQTNHIINDMEYLKRTADEHLSLLLASSGAVLIEGPKWCGKTTTAEQQANSTISLQDPDMRDKYQATIRVKPSLLLLGETPRLIDEWHPCYGIRYELWLINEMSLDNSL